MHPYYREKKGQSDREKDTDTDMSSIFDLFKKIEQQSPASKGPVTNIIVGLGNPGAKYEGTRHNAGFVAIDRIAEKCGVRIDRAKFDALVAEASLGEKTVLLMKPQTFMNLSGKAVQAAANFYKIPPENIIVLCDDVTQKPGKIRIRKSGSAGGQKGLNNIIECLGTQNIPRIRIGVGEKPNPEYDLADWVLGKFPEEDKKAVVGRLDDIKAAAELCLNGDFDRAMSSYNG